MNIDGWKRNFFYADKITVAVELPNTNLILCLQTNDLC